MALCAVQAKKLAGSDLEEFNTIRAQLDEEWEPTTGTERLLLAQMALSQWRTDRALSLEIDLFDRESRFGHSTGDGWRCAKPESKLDGAALALVLRYRTSAERAFYKVLTELQRLRANMRDDERRAEQDEKEAMQREMERFPMAPIARAPQFVSQNPVEQASASSVLQSASHFVSQNPAQKEPEASTPALPSAHPTEGLNPNGIF